MKFGVKLMFSAAKYIVNNDPAARNIWEVMLTYSGFHALAYYRVSHWLYQRQDYLLAAIVAHLGKRTSGVEIHPGAQIGKHVFIDHGMGVVIGETAVIGDFVTILHGVTLGSRRTVAGKRHPQVGNHVLIGANAMLLGPIEIGAFAKIGAGSVVLDDVVSNTTVVGNPALQVQQHQFHTVTKHN